METKLPHKLPRISASELKARYEVNPENDGAHFFERSTMRFFGDTMRNYGCRVVTLHKPDEREALGMVLSFQGYELYRIRPVKHGLCDSRYFDQTGSLLYSVEEI